MRHLALILSLFVAAATPALAQDDGGEPLAPSHLAAAAEMLETMQMEVIMQQSISEMLDLQLRQNPELLPYEDIMRDFMEKHMSWEAVRDEMVALHARHFTEEELRGLTAFYRTELGQKLVEVQPRLMSAGAEIGERQVERNLPELQQRIMERAERM